MTSFSCRVESSLVERLRDPGGPLAAIDVKLTLWWRAPGESRVTIDARGAELDPNLRQRMVEVVSGLPELFLAPPPSRRLVDHRFAHVSPTADDGPAAAVILAEARDVDDERARATFTIGRDGLVVRERTLRRDGATSDLRLRHAEVGGRRVLAGIEGAWQDARVEVDLTWRPADDGRVLPVELRVRELDERGRKLPGTLGEQRFRLFAHAINEPAPDWVFAD